MSNPIGENYDRLTVVIDLINEFFEENGIGVDADSKITQFAMKLIQEIKK